MAEKSTKILRGSCFMAHPLETFNISALLVQDCFFLSFTHLSVCHSRDTARTVEKASHFQLVIVFLSDHHIDIHVQTSDLARRFAERFSRDQRRLVLRSCGEFNVD